MMVLRIPREFSLVSEAEVNSVDETGEMFGFPCRTIVLTKHFVYNNVSRTMEIVHAAKQLQDAIDEKWAKQPNILKNMLDEIHAYVTGRVAASHEDDEFTIGFVVSLLSFYGFQPTNVLNMGTSWLELFNWLQTHNPEE